MCSGIALATKFMRPNCKVIGVEPEGKDLEKCIRAKERLWTDPPQFLDTIAEGKLASHCFFVKRIKRSEQYSLKMLFLQASKLNSVAT